MEYRENPCYICKADYRNKMNCGWGEGDEMTPLPNPCQNRKNYLRIIKEKCYICKSIHAHCVGQCMAYSADTCEDRRG